MRFFAHLIVLFSLLSPFNGLLLADDPKESPLEDVEATIGQHAAAVRSSIVAVQRLGLSEVGAGVKIHDSGVVLAPRFASLDKRESETPYLLLLADGTRKEAELLAENKRRNIVLLRAEGLEDIPSARIADERDHLDCVWVLRPTIPPALLPGEAVQLHLERLIKAGGKPSDRCTFSARNLYAGSPLFGLHGALLGMLDQTGDDDLTASFTPLARLKKDLSELVEFLSEPDEAATLPDWAMQLPNEEQRNEHRHPAVEAIQESLPGVTNLPVVAIKNRDASEFSGTHGIIVSTDGQILTKASRLGPFPTVTWDDTPYPAVLVAEDEATDLALLLIDATNLPMAVFDPEPPKPHSLLWSPMRLTQPPLDEEHVMGLFSHRLAAHAGSPQTLHSPEHVTSLGVVLEQAADACTLAAVFTNGPSAGLLEQGDVLTDLDGRELSSRSDLATALSGYKVGDHITLVARRGEESIHCRVKLGAAQLLPPLSNLTMEEARFLPSIHRSGFPETFVHDAPLGPFQCGSPLYTLDRRLVGINIAIASWGRVLALPAADVQAALKRLRTQSIEF